MFYTLAVSIDVVKDFITVRSDQYHSPFHRSLEAWRKISVVEMWVGIAKGHLAVPFLLICMVPSTRLELVTYRV